MIEIIKEIWNLKWWEIFVIACADEIFFLVKAWFIYVIIIIVVIVFILILIRRVK